MAITVVGFDGTVSEAQFARLMRAHGEVGYKHGVLSGMVTTAAGGTRQASVSAGTAVLPGLLVESDAATTLTFAANASGANRVDYAVVRGDWSANTATIVVVQGSSSTPPALTQTEGTLWQMPLARVTVRPSVTTLLSTDVVVCKPLPRDQILYVGTVNLAAPVAWNAQWGTVATIAVADPGWPYSIQTMSRLRFNTQASGTASMRILDGTSGAWLTTGYTQPLSTGSQDIFVDAPEPSLSGTRSVHVQMMPVSMTSGSLTLNTGQFSLRVVPA